MASSAVNPRKPKGTPEWLFEWRGTRLSRFPGLFATAIVAGAFTFLLPLKVSLTELAKTAPKRASVIYLRDDAQGRALTLRAQEGGPFPSRFQPESWEGLKLLETAGMETARLQTPPYVPQLQDLPKANQLRSFELAAKGESFFPKRSQAQITAPDPIQLQLTPALYPLSGLSTARCPPPGGAFSCG
jgi:hypothetical protein